MLDNSAMFINDGVAKNSGKRKMKEVEAASRQNSLFNDLQGLHFAPSIAPLNGYHSREQQIQTAAAPFKSFQAALLSTDQEDDVDIQIPNEQIDPIITFHCDSLRRAVEGSLNSVADERAAKKLKEREVELHAQLTQNMELEKEVEHYKMEGQRLRGKVRYLEQAKEALRLRLRDAIAARRYAETSQDDAESSFVDPDRVEPLRLECKACQRQLATVMVWPCRHVCVCTSCDADTRACPVCRCLRTSSVEVRLPLN